MFFSNTVKMTSCRLPQRFCFSSVKVKCQSQSQQRSVSTTTSTIDVEVDKFERMASSWWDPGGHMRELHSMNRLRVPLIRDGLLQLQRSEKNREEIMEKSKSPKPLEDFHILDVGCGGGILCEPLGRLGATVKGIDPGPENISVAVNHLPEDLRGRVTYDCTSIEDLVLKNENEKGSGGRSVAFDAIVMSEVIEHVESPENFVRTATQILKPGGSLFMTTLNRTWESWVGAILMWEVVLRKLPVGTHQWSKFITPKEMERILRMAGLRVILTHGMCFNPINNSWKWSKYPGVNYALHAVK